MVCVFTPMDTHHKEVTEVLVLQAGETLGHEGLAPAPVRSLAGPRMAPACTLAHADGEGPSRGTAPWNVAFPRAQEDP